MTEQLSRLDFLNAVTDRYESRCTDKTSRHELYELASYNLRVFLLDEEIEYGDGRYDWSREAAEDVADEDMSYWES